ncbi:ABC transporter ATP-binding protein [Brucella sp. BE17]|uniref:ABC transporter ATP-binding protein n=1 Tax=Brucella sp. BE17 TaxID=3142977 RepID=UPI0031BA76C2
MTPFGLHIRNVTWGPSADRRIIEDISFDVAPRSVTVIVGANGAGKSSLLRCIYRLYRPSGGQTLLDGSDIWKMTPRDVARKIATVLQETMPDFPFTVREVVAMGRMPHRRGLFGLPSGEGEIVETMLERLDLLALAEKPFAVVSGGERQRTLIARALVQEPGLLVLDEPTNHLDIRHQLEILEALRGLDITIVMTLHDLTLAAALADQVIVMHEGHVIARGEPADVLIPAVIRRAFDVEATVSKFESEIRFAFRLPQERAS